MAHLVLMSRGGWQVVSAGDGCGGVSIHRPLRVSGLRAEGRKQQAAGATYVCCLFVAWFKFHPRSTAGTHHVPRSSCGSAKARCLRTRDRYQPLPRRPSHMVKQNVVIGTARQRLLSVHNGCRAIATPHTPPVRNKQQQQQGAHTAAARTIAATSRSASAADASPARRAASSSGRLTYTRCRRRRRRRSAAASSCITSPNVPSVSYTLCIDDTRSFRSRAGLQFERGERARGAKMKLERSST